MIQIDDKIVSQDLFDVLFVCDYDTCKGACCVEGESGVPLDPGVADALRRCLPQVRHLLSPTALQIIEEQGVSYFDIQAFLNLWLFCINFNCTCQLR